MCLILFAKMAASLYFGNNFVAVKSDAPGCCGHVSFSWPPQNSDAASFWWRSCCSEVGQACQGTFVTSADYITKLPGVLMHVLRRTGPNSWHVLRFFILKVPEGRRMIYCIYFCVPQLLNRVTKIPLNLPWTAVESNPKLSHICIL